MKRTTLKVSEVKNNPNNPRLIKDDKFKKLVQSIKDFPEMLETREVVVNKDHIILGGNMRFKAAKEAGLKEIPVKIVDWDEDKQRQFIIKDNVSGGEWDWDLLANEWDTETISDWGLDLPSFQELDDLVTTRDGSLASSLNSEELRDSMSVVLTFDKAGFVEFMTYANYFRQKYNSGTATEAIVESVKEHYENSISAN